MNTAPQHYHKARLKLDGLKKSLENRVKIYVKFAEQERLRSTTNLAEKMFEACLKLDGQKV